jgi:DNA invertase Pin-like site-specific DNA recombinase
MTPAKSLKAFAYLRVSGKGQVDGDGFPRQRAAVKSYADAHAIHVVQFFEEKGVSGTKDLDDRPALQAMMLALLSNGVRTVLIEKLDRLARDLMVQETLIADFRKNGFEVVSVAEPDLCSDDPSRVMVRQLFGIVAQYEKSNIVLKLRAARQRMRARTGRCEGRKPYGEREGEREVIALIRKLSDRGMNYSAIAAKLNADGVSTRYGGKAQWYPANISRIVNRPGT